MHFLCTKFANSVVARSQVLAHRTPSLVRSSLLPLPHSPACCLLHQCFGLWTLMVGGTNYMAAWEVFTFAQLIPCLGLRVMVEKEAAACLLFSCFCLLGEALYHRITSKQSFPYYPPPSNLGLSVSRSHCFLSVFHIMVVVHTFSAPGWHHDKGLSQHSHKVSVLKCPGLAGPRDLWINSRNVRECDFGSYLPSKLGQVTHDTVSQDNISSGEVGQGWLWTTCEYRIRKSGWEDLTWRSFCF